MHMSASHTIGNRSLTRAMVLIGISLLLIVATIVVVLQWNQLMAPVSSARIGNDTFKLRVVQTPAERTQGLSGVSALQPDEGMLFIFPDEDYHGIWMKDMHLALDVLWLNNERVVVHIEQALDPLLGTSQTFYPSEPALYVIELPAGSVTQSGVKRTDRVSFDHTIGVSR